MTLLEWMMGVGIACGLLFGGGYIYQRCQQHSMHIGQALSTTVEMEGVEALIRAHLSSAGFTPCGGVAFLETALQTYDRLSAGIRWHRMKGPITAVEVTGADQVRWPASFEVHSQKSYVIADCYHAEPITIQQHYRGSGTLTHLLNFDYTPPIFLGEWVSEAVYVSTKSQHLMYHSEGHAEVLSDAVIALEVEPIEKRGIQMKLRTREGGVYHWKIRLRNGM